MKKLLLIFSGLFILLFIFITIKTTHAAPAPEGIAVNPKTKQCAGFWAGDEFTKYGLPSGWKAYYTDGAEYQRYFVSKKGTDSTCKLANKVYKGDPGWTDETTGLTYDEAKSCCQKLGYKFIFEDFSNRPFFFKYSSYYESFNDIREKNNSYGGALTYTDEVRKFITDSSKIRGEIIKTIEDAGAKYGYSAYYPINEFEYKGFSKKLDKYRNLKNWEYFYVNPSLKQCTVATLAEINGTEADGNENKFFPLRTEISEGWEQNWVNHRLISDVITTESGRCKYNRGDEEKCCKELNLKYVSSNIGMEAINKLSAKLSGKILLQVESRGEAWYISPADNKRYGLGRQDDAFNLMRGLGVGISNSNLAKIKIANENLTGQDSDNDGLSDMAEDSIGTNKNNQDSDGDGYKDKDEIVNGYNPLGSGKLALDNNFAKNQAGKILLQVEKHGEAWYVNPDNNQRYFLGRPSDAYNLMRKLGLGVSNNDLNKITQALSKKDFQPYQKNIIDKIIKSEKSFSYVGEEYPIMSWNDNNYGRIYAELCSPATTMYACSDCQDGGVNYFNASGDYIGKCNSMGPDEIKPPYDCEGLTNLKYQDADYASMPCDKNK